MSDVKHTPLPWSIVPQNDGSAMIAHEYQTGKQMNPKGLRLIAHVLARGNSLQMDEANAAVIVAAVNAYAALEKLCQQQHEALEKAEQENVALKAENERLTKIIEDSRMDLKGFDEETLAWFAAGGQKGK